MNGTRESLWITRGTTDDSSMCWAVFMGFFFSPFNPPHLEQHHLLLPRLAVGSSRPVVPSLSHCHILRCDSFFKGLRNIFSSSWCLRRVSSQSGAPWRVSVSSTSQRTISKFSVTRHTSAAKEGYRSTTWDKTIIFFPGWSSFDALFCFLDLLFFVISDSEFSAFHPREDWTFWVLLLFHVASPTWPFHRYSHFRYNDLDRNWTVVLWMCYIW